MEKFKLKALIAVGGLCFSGKSSSCFYLWKVGFQPLKLIDFEKKYLLSRDIHFDESNLSEVLDNLYLLDQEYHAINILNLILEFIEEKKIELASVESFYRPDLIFIFRKILLHKLHVLYLEAPFEIRLNRGWLKRQKQQNYFDIPESLEDYKEFIMKRDEFKRRLGAEEVKNYSNKIISNDISKDLYIEQLRNFGQQVKKECHL